MASVNTNFSALVALQNLNSTTRDLEQVQNRINTGFKVASAKDNGAVFAIAQTLRGRVGALSAVSDGIDRAVTNLDTAQAAGTQVSDILKTLKEKAELAKTFGTPAERQAAHDDFVAARDKIDDILNAATINGVNLLNGSNLANGLRVNTSDIGTAGPSTIQQVRGGSASDTLVSDVATLASTTTITDQAASAVAAPTGTIAVATGDTLRFALLDDAGNTTETVNIVISDYATLGALADAVSDRTGGAVNLTYSGDRLSYDSNQNFTVSFVTGTATQDTAGDIDDNLTVDARILFFTGQTTTVADGVAAGGAAITTASLNTSSARQTGGGNQYATSALTAGTTTATTTLSLASSTTASVTLTTTAGSGDTNAYVFTLSSGQTLGQFLNEVSSRTNGAVTAAYDADSRQIVYKSSLSFTVANSNASAFGSGSSAATQDVTRTASVATTTVTGYDYRVVGGALAGLASLDLTTDPTTASATIDTLAATLNTALANLGAQGRALETQRSFLTVLSDNIEKGIGQLVDADLAKESARLQSLQVKQQLGAQALSIANQAPSLLLSFFR
ncbi:MAG: hypothetical protein GC189_12520 [Alphaproteobacteria bacterium]|nr:hypothetical protein [Alphaproteobacteria bacterium]